MPIKTFNEFMLSLDNRALQIIITETDRYELAKVLSTADTETRDRVFNNMPKLSMAILKENLECIGPVDQKDIEKVQNKIISMIHHLKSTGEIVLSGGDYSPDKTIIRINDDYIKYTIECIEEACNNKDKCLYLPYTEEVIKHALAEFENRRDELSRIQSVEVSSGLLPAIAPLFETDTIRDLTIKGDGAAFQWPSSLEKCHNLTSLLISPCEELTEFPSWIRYADSLQRLSVGSSGITSIPDWIGDLQSLTELSLKFNKNLKTLPDSIGNLKNLTMLDISGTPIEQLPSSIENLSALKYVNICRTNIHTVPQSISSVETFIDTIPVEIIPQKYSLSYRDFVNCYYKLAKTVYQFSEKARREDVLSIEDEIELLGDDLFRKGLWQAVCGTDYAVLRNLLEISLDHEHDYYRNKLMEIAIEGVLGIQSGDSTFILLIKLNSMVKIKDNPIDAAVVKLLAGDDKAFSNIDFDAVIQPEEEREEIRLIKRAVFISEAARPRREGLPAYKNHLDYEAIANRDIFEYGISMIGCDLKLIDDVLSRLIAHETDPVQKNIAMAKKEAALSILNGDNTRITILKLLAYFDKNVTKALAGELLKD
jgi:Leucine-rich repeat (LRR) protein